MCNELHIDQTIPVEGLTQSFNRGCSISKECAGIFTKPPCGASVKSVGIERQGQRVNQMKAFGMDLW